MLSSPRPILKRSSSSSTQKHVVHFPPSPALTRTFVAHSPAHYDRSPIVVGPNVCALPERGGRTYVLDDQPANRRSPSKSGRLLHPRAISHIPSMPSLIPDLSSESDESDTFPSPQLENQEFFFGPHHGLKAPPAALSFLPYSPSNPYQQPLEDEAIPQQQQNPRRRRNDTSRRKSSSSSSSSRLRPSSPQVTLCDSFSSFTLRDDGCLGGF